MDGDNRRYTFDTTSNSIYDMIYFYKDGTWNLNNYISDNSEKIKLSDSEVKELEELLKKKSLIPNNITLKYDDNNFLRWDVGNIDIKSTKKDFINGTIMITISDSKDIQSLHYGITDNKYVRDMEIISPKDAFEKVKKGEFYSYNPYNPGDKIQITNFEINYMYDSKGYYQPVYKFIGSVNGEKEVFNAVIPALK